MSIHVIYGPGGAGKSLFQLTEVLIPQLRETKRNIITNLPLELGKLSAYLEKKYPGEDLRPLERIRVISGKEAGTFWRIRGPLRWSLLVHPANCYAVPDMVESISPDGVCYIIDEAGDVGFSAISWAENLGKSSRAVECLHYLDQQRKLGDDSFFSTNGRAPGAIAKGFRDKAHFFIRLKNNRLAVFGPFRGSNDFRWQKFTIEPTPSNGAEPVTEGKFYLDPNGSADCYRTQDGNNIVGNGADKGARAKGWSIYWVFPIFIGISSLAFVVPWLLGKGTQAVIGHKTDVVRSVLPKEPKSSTPAATPAQSIETLRGGTVPQGAQPVEVYATGVLKRGEHVTVTLSDGSTLYDAQVLALSKNEVFGRDGRKYRFRTVRESAGLGARQLSAGTPQQGAALDPRIKPQPQQTVPPGPPMAPGKQGVSGAPSGADSPFKPNSEIGGRIGSR